MAADDDKAIVTKAQALPVDAVPVVRVFAGDTGAPPNVVVVVYDKPGAVLAAFNGKAGEALVGPNATDGAQVQAMDAVAKITKSTDATSTDAQKKYDEQHL